MGEPAPHRRGAGADAGAGRAGDARRRVRLLHRPDLRAEHLQRHARTGLDRERGRAVRRHLRDAQPLRPRRRPARPVPRGGCRRQGVRRARADIALPQPGPRHGRADGGPRGRVALRRRRRDVRPVPVPRREHDPALAHSGLGARGRAGDAAAAHRRQGRARPDSGRRLPPVGRLARRLQVRARRLGEEQGVGGAVAAGHGRRAGEADGGYDLRPAHRGAAGSGVRRPHRQP